MMDPQTAEQVRKQRDDLVTAALPHVAFDGWTAKTLQHAARDLGWDPQRSELVFPGGALEAVAHFSDMADRMMLVDLAALDLIEMGLTKRVAAAIHLRLERWAPERETIRRGLALLALPQNAATSLRLTYDTVDTVWKAAGDRSADFNYYTKRASLAAVYGAVLLYWLEDQSDGFADTWDFLDRRLDDVVRFHKAKARFVERLENVRLPKPPKISMPKMPFGSSRMGRSGRRFG